MLKREKQNIKMIVDQYLMPSCNYIVHWHFAPVEIGVIVVVVLAADIVVIDALQKRFFLVLGFCVCVCVLFIG